MTPDISFEKQKTLFAQANWSISEPLISLPVTFAAASPSPGQTGFAFSAEASPAANGLRIDGLRLFAPEVPAGGENILERIEFRDVAVEFADRPGVLVPFDFNQAISFGLKIKRTGQIDPGSSYPGLRRCATSVLHAASTTPLPIMEPSRFHFA